MTAAAVCGAPPGGAAERGVPFSLVIPARFDSSRLPGKPLADLCGKPMIQHVWERACQSQAQEVVVATDHPAVAAAAGGFGARVCMTRSSHSSGTERLQEVAVLCGWDDQRILVNVQGDEPLISPAFIDKVARGLEECPEAAVATLCCPLREPDQLFDADVVKVVTDARGRALYFSRAPVPWDRDRFARAARPPGTLDARDAWQRHLGLYAYRVGLLHRFVRWQPSPLEQLEKLEQLRILWQGETIHVARVARDAATGVDTPADLERVRALMQSPATAADTP
ncbi:MAG: 3-deoxy-manno-octulosonate cytidylyltransferase [Kistimonas sp.]|nr:3-deoxy-manno-octulosonate cytidylyltransferase [Kistimonas sp.]